MPKSILLLFFLSSCASFHHPPAQEQPPSVQQPARPKAPQPFQQYPPQQPQIRQQPPKPVIQPESEPQPSGIEERLEYAFLSDLVHFLAVRQQDQQQLDAAYDRFTLHHETIAASPRLTALMEQFIIQRKQAAHLSSEVDRLYSTVPDDQFTVSLALRSENPSLIESACLRYNRKSAALAQARATYTNSVLAAQEAASVLQKSLPPVLVPVSYPQRSPQ